MVKAGYTQNYAQYYNNKMLYNVGIQEAIDAKVQQIRTKTVATRAIRQKFWSDTMHNPKVKMSDRLRASELLGKSESDFTETRRVVTDDRVKEFTPEEIASMRQVAELYVLHKAGRLSKLKQKLINSKQAPSEDNNSETIDNETEKQNKEGVGLYS